MSVDDAALGVPELPEGFERTVWARLEPSLQSRAWRMAVAVVLFSTPTWSGPLRRCGCGRRLLRRPTVPPAPGAPGTPAPRCDDAAANQNQVRERILLVDLGDHLDRSQRVLVELVSAEGAAADFAGERDRAEQLVSANRLYRETAAPYRRRLRRRSARPARAGARGGRGQPVESVGVASLDEVRRRIESGSLLFKVRVVSSDLQERRKAAVRQTGQRSSL